MSKRKDQERAEKGEVFRSGQKQKQPKCRFPRCSNPAWEKSKLGLCVTCDYIINLVSWFDKEMEKAAKQQGEQPVLLVPKPGMSDSVLKEAIEQARKSGARGLAIIGKEGP